MKSYNDWGGGEQMWNKLVLLLFANLWNTITMLTLCTVTLLNLVVSSIVLIYIPKDFLRNKRQLYFIFKLCFLFLFVVILHWRKSGSVNYGLCAKYIYCLFLYSLKAENGFCIFKCLKENQILLLDIWNLRDIPISMFITKVILEKEPFIHLYTIYGCVHARETIWPKEPKIFTIWSSTESFADPWARTTVQWQTEEMRTDILPSLILNPSQFTGKMHVNYW